MRRRRCGRFRYPDLSLLLGAAAGTRCSCGYKLICWELPMSEKEQKALGIARRLVDAGFRAVFAGGCVRDRILGVEPKDFDIATDARPEVVLKLFDRTIAVGAKFGVIEVLIGDEHFQIATFRADAAYLDGRRPSAVRLCAIEEDGYPRALTIGGGICTSRCGALSLLWGCDAS